MIHFIVSLFKSFVFSREHFLTIIRDELKVDKWVFLPTFSGRVALRQVTEVVKNCVKGSGVLIPRYICNVVPLAVENGGMTPVFYETDNKFYPDKEEILCKIENNNIGMLILVPLYGSTGGISFLNDKRFVDKLLSLDIFICIDGCQNIEFLKKTLRNIDPKWRRIIAVCSFNDKNIPGLLGGGILVHENEVATYSRTIENKIRITIHMIWIGIKKYVLLKMKYIAFCSCKNIVQEKSTNGNHYEFTFGTDFPYQFKYYKPTKLQLSMAAQGLSKMAVYQKRQKEFLDEMKGDYVDLPEVVTSSHLLWKGTYLPNGWKTKTPYALHKTPNESMKPHLLIIENKGF
jgi:hypothetical protein